MRRCYELAHIVGVSKTAYVPATPGCLDWRRDLQRASTDNSPPHPIDQPRRLRLYGMSQTLQRHHGRTTPYGRRRALLVAVLALLAATAFAAPRHCSTTTRVAALARANRDSRHHPAHIVGISKTTYAPATPRCFD